MDNNSPKIAVIGAGVIGMTVAGVLQKDLRNANISIIADSFKEDTTSAVAVGIFRPSTSFRGRTREITKQWINDSWYFWQDILKTPEAHNAGLMRLSTYIFSKENYNVTRNHLIEDLVPVYRAVDEDELKLCGEGWKYGSFFSTIKVECDRYLPWAEKSFIENGGKIVRQKIDKFASLNSKYDLVFNCTGIGAKVLCNDYDLVPLRGQIVKARVPSLKMAFYGDYDTFVVPGLDGVATLGGVRHYESYNRQVCQHDKAAILERCYGLLPFLKSAEIVADKVGFGPQRVPVRVEPELIDGVKVVHCYGHGDYGVMCAPGTALDAVKKGYDLLKSNIRSKM